MSLENYCNTMDFEYLHSWAFNAQIKLDKLKSIINEMSIASTPSLSASPEGREYLLKINNSLIFILVSYRKNMTENVLHNWSVDAQKHINNLLNILVEMQETVHSSFSTSPEGRKYLLKIKHIINL